MTRLLRHLMSGLLVVGCTAATAADARRPNVVLLLVDDQGYGDLSCHGNPVVKTPALDRLHAESVRFTDFHVSSMCTPTRGQLLTGVDALRNGAMNVSSGRSMLRPEFPTLAELFAAAGYRCGHFGKWHVGDTYPYRPQDRGFHETITFGCSYIGGTADFWGNDYFDDTYWHDGVPERFPGYCTDLFFAHARRFILEAVAADRPFFVYLPLNSAHTPHFVPKKYAEPYADRPQCAAYYGMIANIDENVARFDAFLAEHGVRDDTIFIYLTDNGATVGAKVFNAGMRGKKQELYEGGHRVPCFVRWPNGKIGSPRDVPVLAQCQDLAPTLLDLCDLPNDRSITFDGVTLARLLRGESQTLDERMCVIQYSRMNAARPRHGDACVLWNTWRLVGDRELYDIVDDPAQERDVAAEHPDVVAKMRSHYAAWWSTVAPRVNEPTPIIVGHTSANPVLLNPADWYDVFLDQQGQVSRGEAKNGPWHLDVAEAGAYDITLSRWPFDAAAPIAGPGPHGGGTAIPAASIRLKIADVDDTQRIGQNDRSVTFAVNLPAGRTTLQSWLSDEAGNELCGAYYAQVRRK